MKTSLVLLALLAASLAAPLASAQTQQTIALTATAPTSEIPYAGSVKVPVSVTVSCAAILQNLAPGAPPEAEVEVHADETPEWLTVTGTTLSFSATDCASSNAMATDTKEVTLAVSKAAPGVALQNVTLAAHFGDDTPTDEAEVAFKVAYFSNYTVVPDAVFPLKVVNGVAKFNVTVTQRSNARSMVMFEGVVETAGKLSGLVSQPYDTSAPKRFPVTFKAPVGEWTNATVKITTFGHWLLLDQTAGNFTNAKTFTWSFINGGGQAPEASSSVKPSPGAGVGLISVLVVAALAAARRRSA